MGSKPFNANFFQESDKSNFDNVRALHFIIQHDRLLWRPVVTRVCRPGVWWRRGFGPSKLSRGFSSARRPVLDAPVVFWTASVEPVLLGHPTAFLTAGFPFYDGGSGPPLGQRSLTSLFSRRRGFTHSPSVCRLAHRPSLSSSPAFLPPRVLSGLPEP